MREPLNGGHLSASNRYDWRYTGTGGGSVDVDGTSTTERHSATKLRAGQIQYIPEHPKERHLRVTFKGLQSTVQGKGDWRHVEPPFVEGVNSVGLVRSKSSLGCVCNVFATVRACLAT